MKRQLKRTSSAHVVRGISCPFKVGPSDNDNPYLYLGLGYVFIKKKNNMHFAGTRYVLYML